jgi:HPt (histidine-containing phosphotransfer) domain-containing protein
VTPKGDVDPSDMPPADGGELSLVTPDALARLREWGGDALLSRMIELLLELAPQRLEALTEGERSGDMATVEGTAHSLKSSAGNLGALRLQREAEQLELAARRGDEARVHRLVSDIQDSWVRTELELKRVHPSLAGSGQDEENPGTEGP